VKFQGAATQLAVNGTLASQGTAQNPVILTSVKDDSVGGDSNGDGSATTPGAADWNSVLVAGGGTANLAYTTIRFAGFGNPAGGILNNGGSVTLSNSALSNNGRSSTGPFNNPEPATPKLT
jgi:hypothetical protein